MLAAGDRRPHQRSAGATLSGKGRPDRPRRHARSRAHGDAQRHRQPVERSPAVDGSPEGRHRAARLRSERSADRVQERILHLVPGHDGSHRRRDHPVSVLPAGDSPGVLAAAARSEPAAAGAAFLADDEDEATKRKTRRRGAGDRECATNAAPRKPPCRISRAISSARKTRKWPSCNSPAAPLAQWKRNKPSPKRKPAATIPVPAAAARNTKNAAELNPYRLFYCLGAAPAIWPEHLGQFERKSVKQRPPANRCPANEYGQEEAEEASYGHSWLQRNVTRTPPAPTRHRLRCASTRSRWGITCSTCTGNCPKNLAGLVESLPKLSHSALPALRNYLPAKNIVPHSERYILGPTGLGAAAPQIPGVGHKL